MYKGKTILITGSSRGVGSGLAKHFRENGATVIGLNRKSGDGHWSFMLQCDLSKPQEITAAFDELAKHLPPVKVDILINNAAVLTSQYSLKMAVEDAEAMVFVDMLAPYLVTRECVKRLMKVPYGRVINISSMAVVLEPQGDSMYAACKAGLTTMTNIMAKEYAFLNITCNTLAISAIETDMLKQLNKEKVDKVVNSLPLPRYATMADIINVVDFFAAERSHYITAQTIYLGGVHA